MELGHRPTVIGRSAELHARHVGAFGTFFPFTRWQYYEGGRKFARNAPSTTINEIDFGLEFAKWAEVEVTAMFTRTFDRMRTNSYPYLPTTNGHRVGLQVQWNY